MPDRRGNGFLPLSERWTRDDLPLKRLLDAIGAPDFDYYRAAEEQAVADALRAWPLLQAVARHLVDGLSLVQEEPAR